MITQIFHVSVWYIKGVGIKQHEERKAVHVEKIFFDSRGRQVEESGQPVPLTTYKLDGETVTQGKGHHDILDTIGVIREYEDGNSIHFCVFVRTEEEVRMARTFFYYGLQLMALEAQRVLTDIQFRKTDIQFRKIVFERFPL